MPYVGRKEFQFKAGRSLAYTIEQQDGEEWKQAEKLLVDAAYRLRLWHHVPGNTPPLPSAQFRIHGPHKTSAAARKLIKLGRDWFGVWIGFLSYIVAQAKRPENWGDLMKPDTNIPVPPWYIKFLTDSSYTEDWLDGLMSSTVCQFDSKTPRAGIIYQLSVHDKTRPPIEWFFEHDIPVYYPWTAVEEEAVSRNPALRYLQPPDDLVHKALDELFKNPVLPIGALVMRQYYRHGESAQNITLKALRVKYASSTVYRYVVNKFGQEKDRLAEYYEDIDQGMEQVQRILKERETEQQKAARQGASMPTQSLIVLDRDCKGQLVEHVRTYFQRRDNRNRDVLAVEDPMSRALRLERERDPPKVHTTMYQWTTVRSSGGVELYMHVRVPAERQASAHASCHPTCRMYDSLNNEWDLYSEIQNAFEEAGVHGEPRESQDDWSGHDMALDHDTRDGMGADLLRTEHTPAYDDYLGLDVSDYGDDISPASSPRRSPDFENQYSGRHNAQPPSQHSAYVSGASAAPSTILNFDPPHPPHYLSHRQVSQPPPNPRPFVSSTPSGPSATVDAGNAQTEPLLVQSHSNEDVAEHRDMIRSLKFSYGYVPSLYTGPPQKISNWESISQNFGFKKDGGSSQVGSSDRDAISRFWAALCGDVSIEMPQDISDLNDSNHAALSLLQDFRMIFRPIGNMFVFSEPRSENSEWLLAVQTPLIALYVCRLLLADRSYTIVSVAKELLCLGIPFRTLLPFSEFASASGRSRVSTVVHPYSPTSFRREGYVFTPKDYNAYMLQCQALLRQPQGRAALLKGGIISRIAKQYLSIDQVLEGPSVEMKEHHIGYVVDETRRTGHAWCDDELTANELATICGTYSIYTGKGGQLTVRSWFPPANFWADANTSQFGCKWVEWTEKNEEFFVKLVADIKAGKSQPLSASVWKKKFRGNSTVRALMANAQTRAQNFVDAHIPVHDIAMPVLPAQKW